ncbi:hypothetical protein [Flavobacterium sp.]
MAGRTTGRIIIPTNPTERLELAQKIYDKHLLDGTSSPLNAMEDYKWAEEGPKIAPCKKNNDDAETAAKLAETLYRQRDVDLPNITKTINNSAALLKSIHAKNPKKLGEYGFVVDDTPKPRKPKKE